MIEVGGLPQQAGSGHALDPASAERGVDREGVGSVGIDFDRLDSQGTVAPLAIETQVVGPHMARDGRQQPSRRDHSEIEIEPKLGETRGARPTFQTCRGRWHRG